MTGLEIVSELTNLDSQFKVHFIEGHWYINVITLIESNIEVHKNGTVTLDDEVLEYDDPKDLMLVIFGMDYIESKI